METRMTVTTEQVLAQLRRVKGPDLDGNLVDLGLISEVLIKDGKAYFAITVPASRASELEPLRQAAEKVVKDIPGRFSGLDGRGRRPAAYPLIGWREGAGKPARPSRPRRERTPQPRPQSRTRS
jgi:ATP-binding protein involved in chromosome partitioning